MLEICEATEDNPFIHGMSKQFVRALQQLFDVMDTDNSGTIKYCDISIQWEEDQSDPFFPKGLVGCLAKVTLPNGLLTFDRFCAGIKLCLLKNQVDINSDDTDDFLTSPLSINDSSSTSLNHGQLLFMSQIGTVMAKDEIPSPQSPVPTPAAVTRIESSTQVSSNNSSSITNSTLTMTRPPSEPQIFAPPPPPPSSTYPVSMSVNDPLNSSSVSSVSLTTTSNPPTATSESEESLSPKKSSAPNSKRPLPTYEQVMAAKNNLKPTGLLSKFASGPQSDPELSPRPQSPNQSNHIKESSEITVNSLMLALPPKSYSNGSGNTGNNNGVSKLFVKPALGAPPPPAPTLTSNPSLNCSTSPNTSYPQNLYENFNTLSSLTQRNNLPTSATNIAPNAPNNGNHPIPLKQHSAPFMNHPHHQQQQQSHPHSQHPHLSSHHHQHPSTHGHMFEPIYGQRAKSMTHLDIISTSVLSSTMTNGHRMTNFSAEMPSTEVYHHLPEFSAPLAQRSFSMEHGTSMTNGQAVPPSSNSNSAQQPPQASQTSSSSLPKTLSRNYIMKTLQNWRDNILQHNGKTEENRPSVTAPNSAPALNIQVSKQQQQQQSPPQPGQLSKQPTEINTNGLPVPPPKPPLNLNRTNENGTFKKRREPRRHTVGANGIDIYTIKRYQLLEQEKDILLRGLGEVDKTKEWFLRQISGIQDKINLVGRGQASGIGPGSSDCNIDAYQERINFQAARVSNLNQHMTSMRDAGQNFPLHMNLAFRPFNVPPLKLDPNSPKQLVVNPNLVNKLKEQNRLLTEEVGRKGEHITQLEREKSALIRELFQARTYGTYYGNSADFDDTLM